jgi:oligopeptide/dipeptide ABC transporter ATP-binding protein
MSALLEVRRIKKFFPVVKGVVLTKVVGWIKAVDDVSFAIQAGETFGLVGESGCGKSTIAKTILLLEQTTSGAIFFRGRQVSLAKKKELAEYRSEVQSVFQDPTSSLNPRMRVGSIVSEPLVINSHLPKNQIKERIEEALIQVGLRTGAADRFAHEFSGGQRQRIAVARSLIVRPSLIVLDEPVSALDVSIQAQIMNMLKELQDKLGMAYLFIAHDLATVRYMSNRIGVMYLGKLVEHGPADEVYLRRAHPYTQALFSAHLPSHPDVKQEEIVLSGEVPSAYNLPSGCRFHTRCNYAMPICSQTEPELIEVAPVHYAACHLMETARKHPRESKTERNEKGNVSRTFRLS